MKPASYLVAALLLALPLPAGEAWVDLPPLLTPRQEVGVGTLAGLVYVVGGITADRAAAAIVERFDPAGGGWERVKDLPLALHHIGVAALDGRLFTIGGLDNGFQGVSSCFAYDPGANSWEEVAPLPTRRGAVGAAATGGRIFAAGGQTGSTTVPDFAAYTPGAGVGTWEILPAMPTARNHLAAAAVGDHFFALSGRSSGLRPEVEAYDPASRMWSGLAPILTPRGGIAAAAIGTGIFVFGGEGNASDPSGVFPQTERYDTVKDEWAARTDMNIPRHGIGAAVVGDTIFIPGGSRVEGFGVTDASTAYLPRAEDLPPFVRGDAMADGGIDIADPIRILFHLFAGDVEVACADAADADDDGSITLTDAIYLLEHLFRGGPPPPAPAMDGSGDPSPDRLDCG